MPHMCLCNPESSPSVLVPLLLASGSSPMAGFMPCLEPEVHGALVTDGVQGGAARELFVPDGVPPDALDPGIFDPEDRERRSVSFRKNCASPARGQSRRRALATASHHVPTWGTEKTCGTNVKDPSLEAAPAGRVPGRRLGHSAYATSPTQRHGI